MKVTEVQILPIRPRNGLIGFATIVLDHAIQISDLAVFTRPQGGFRIGYPKKKLPNGKDVPIFRPLTRELDQTLEVIIARKFEEILLGKEVVKDSNVHVMETMENGQ